MPYYHRNVTHDWIDYGRYWSTRQEAHTAFKVSGYERPSDAPNDPTDKWEVTFEPDSYESGAWQGRELDHFANGDYVACPWNTKIWYCGYSSPCRLHFAHLSLTHPGLIAYTPSEEFGVQDRQLRVTPGKYLTQFAKDHLTLEQIAEYVAAVKSFDGSFKIATTAEEIIAVYRNGPDSCMSHRESSYTTGGIHPVSVYAGSDLALAYLGSIDTGVSARCIIWPDKKIRTRIYGDATLRHVLQSAGYTDGYGDGNRDVNGLHGATLPAIETSYDRYVMPYIDAAQGCRLETRNGKHVFVLCDDSEADDAYSIKQACGATSDEPDEDHDEQETYTCSHGECMNDVDDPGDICQDCLDLRYTCPTCNRVRYSDTSDQHEDVYGESICDRCWMAEDQTCANDDCGEDWNNYELDNKVDRERRHVSALCPSCAGDTKDTVPQQRCTDCAYVFDADESRCPSCDHAVRCETTLDLLSTVAEVNAAIATTYQLEVYAAQGGCWAPCFFGHESQLARTTDMTWLTAQREILQREHPETHYRIVPTNPTMSIVESSL